MKGEVQLGPAGDQTPNDSDPLLENQADSSPGSSTEINDEDVESGSIPCCRICLESDAEPEDEMISPCMCKGTQQFVHRSCLDHWRSVKEGFAFSHCTTCKAQFHLRVELFEDNSWRKIKFRVFVARDVFLVFLAVQTVIAAIGGFAYLMDRDGAFRNSFDDGWDRILSKHPIPFYYCIGVLAFFVLLGFFGLILHCSSLNNNDPRMAGCQNCCYGWGILDCFPASMEACFALVIVFVVIFAILGIAYGFLAATMAIQRIWQRHYHILTKRELTKARELLGMLIALLFIQQAVKGVIGEFGVPRETENPLLNNTSIPMALCERSTGYNILLWPSLHGFKEQKSKITAVWHSVPDKVPFGVPRRLQSPLPWDPSTLLHWTVTKDMGQVPGGYIYAAIVPALMIAGLYFFDHSGTSQMAQQKEFNLKNPPSYHNDIFVLGVMTLIFGLLGLPPSNGLLPQSPMHTKCLAILKRKDYGFYVAPQVLWGYFAYMAVDSLHGNQFWERVLEGAHPSFVESVPFKYMMECNQSGFEENEVDICDAEILDEFTTNRGELKLISKSFRDDNENAKNDVAKFGLDGNP
ncbi:hypothetical protein FNV43_RR16453 [Rhamnella rubrinervis]|uniref:RING-CH-type domain-containing protein n=1 Tax=Rhamnella rubrinervis TaxID=2594499 RepID=A0A8K0MD37_9ROSA|nr:hypothetical protein FNV43_RR16453 [Rhamnella rubrinervis]